MNMKKTKNDKQKSFNSHRFDFPGLSVCEKLWCNLRVIVGLGHFATISMSNKPPVLVVCVRALNRILSKKRKLDGNWLRRVTKEIVEDQIEVSLSASIPKHGGERGRDAMINIHLHHQPTFRKYPELLRANENLVQSVPS